MVATAKTFRSHGERQPEAPDCEGLLCRLRLLRNPFGGFGLQRMSIRCLKGRSMGSCGAAGCSGPSQAE